MTMDDVKNLKTRMKTKTPPWLSAALALVSSVALMFLLLASMEQAFGSVEDFLEKMPNGLWFFQVPIPIICTGIVYYTAQQSQKRSLTTLVFMSSFTTTGVIGVLIYLGVSDLFIAIYHSKADFYYILIITSISLVVGFLSLLILKLIRNK